MVKPPILPKKTEAEGQDSDLILINSPRPTPKKRFNYSPPKFDKSRAIAV
jgi:hypothetical protein